MRATLAAAQDQLVRRTARGAHPCSLCGRDTVARFASLAEDRSILLVYPLCDICLTKEDSNEAVWQRLLATEPHPGHWIFTDKDA